MAPSVQSHGLQETLDVFDRTARGTPLTTAEVAEQLDVGRRSTYARLERLVERDLLSTKKVGARGRVWWRPPAAESAPDDVGQPAGGAPAAELERVFDRIDDVFWAIDDEFRFTYINDSAEDLLQRSADELVGENVWEALPWLESTNARAELETAMATGSAGHYEDYLEETGRWYDVRVYPSESGLSVYFRDVSEREERERRLAESERRNRTLVDNFPNGVIALFDRDLRHTLVGGTLFEVIDMDVQDVEGKTVREIFPADIADQLEPNFHAVFDGESNVVEVAAGDRVRQFRTLPVRDDDGEVVAGLGMSQDVTERKNRERELERYETIVETIDDGVYAVDEDENVVFVNDALCAMVGYDRDELIGNPGSTIADESIQARADTLASELVAGDRDLATLDFDLQTSTGESVPVETRLARYPIGDGHGRCGVVRDVTERIERERELERYAGIVDAVGEPVYELDERGRFTFVNDALVERSGYAESELLGEHVSIGMDDDDVARVQAHMLEYVANGGGNRTTVEFDVITGDGRRLPVENRIYLRRDEEGRYTGSAGILWDVTDRVERQRELERQRERLTALNELNEVVGGITEAVIDQSTREEIERIVCERLADSDSYLFAWIGDVDGHTGRVNMRYEAGVEGYLDDLTISADPDDPRSTGPTGRALIEREIQVAQDARGEPYHDSWLEAVEEYGFRSTASIPIVHGATRFGVLNIYAERPYAFTENERTVIGRLGEVVGHAIAAVERKRALMGDEIVEVEFRAPDVFEALDVPINLEGTIDLKQAVPIGGGSYLVYGSTTGDGMEAVHALVESASLGHWSDVNVLSEEADGCRIEIRMDDPPIPTTVAAQGGYVYESAFRGRMFYMRIHLAPSADVRDVSAAIQEVYPTVSMVTRRQVTRSRPDAEGRAAALVEELTDRQRVAIQTAFLAGYFEWPRDSNGGDVAGSLGIDPSTFHHHLREAQRKILERVLATDAPA